MSKKENKVLYWISIVPPVVDCIVGLIKGIIKGYYDCKLQAVNEWNAEQQRKFENTFKN